MTTVYRGLPSQIIAQYLVDDRWSLYTVHKFMQCDEYPEFIKWIRRIFIQNQLNEKRVDTFYELLQKVTYKHRVYLMSPYKEFKLSSIKPSMIFKNCEAKHRGLIYYLSIYHGYVWEKKEIDYFPTWGGKCGSARKNLYELEGEVHTRTWLARHKYWHPDIFKKVKNKYTLYSLTSDIFYKLDIPVLKTERFKVTCSMKLTKKYNGLKI